ncbi:MAG: helix-turn-helix domain-containing protein [Clostridiales bacterium]|nr:helix-turn-helix domain-containing protein [Clostridiales bacterium]
MLPKKVEELDFYDLLNLPLDASPQEIEKAYLQALATYHDGALASYGVLAPQERRLILDKIEAAFSTLADTERRKDYDSRILPSRPEYRQRAYFRKSTIRLEIEDAGEKERFWDKVKCLLFLRKRRKDGRNAREITFRAEFKPEANGRYYGEYLKLVRENRGLSREEIARDCNLSVAFLEALEEENTSALPRGKDPASLLQLYARALGLNSENGRSKNRD